jgi:adenylate cyclase
VSVPERPTDEQLEAAGLYDPHAPDAPQRHQLIAYLVDLGATLDDLVREENQLPALASVLTLWPSRERVDLAEVSRRSGIDARVIARVWRASGLLDPSDRGAVFTTRDVEMFSVLGVGIELLGEEVMIQFMRVLGSAAQRVAEAAVSAFVVNVVPASMAEDPSGLALAHANAMSSQLLNGLAEGFDILLRHHLELARRPIDVDVARGVEVRLQSIAFVDLVGFTAVTQQLEFDELARALTAFESRASEIVIDHDGRVVKLIGDEIMYVTKDAQSAVDVALALADAFSDDPVLPPVRIGIATGEVIARDGDFSGDVVNRAARAVKVADPGTVLADANTTEDLAGCTTVDAGDFKLKGFERPQRLFRVSRSA